MNQQREEQSNEILVFIVDRSYGNETDFVDVELYDDEIAVRQAAGQAYFDELVTEFDQELESVNVGPGADLPAFAAAITENIIPLLPWLMAVFFSGKPIVDNVDAWQKIYKYMSRYLMRDILLNRHGAAVLAVEAVFADMDGIPRSLKMISYRSEYRYDEKPPIAQDGGQVDEAPPTLNLSMVRHVFEIEADNVKFLVVVDGKTATARRV
jgi:hypothetical protein